MELARAGHDNGVMVVYLNEFADEGWAFHEGYGHLDIVVSDGSGGLGIELELTIGGAGVVVEDFLRAFLLACFMASLMASIRLKGFYCFSREAPGESQRRWGA